MVESINHPPNPNRSLRHVYAIVRVDEFQNVNVTWEDKVTVKCVVADAETAAVEVDRLNHLNSSKGCCYFAQLTRLVGSDVFDALPAPPHCPPPFDSPLLRHSLD